MSSMEQYLALPAVSQGVLQTLLDRCPKAAWHESFLNAARPQKISDEMDLGTIAHSVILEGTWAGVTIIDPLDHPAEKGGATPTGWTNKSIRAARDQARAEGRIPILKSKQAEIQEMVNSVGSYIQSLKSEEPAIWDAFQPTGGQSEVNVTWRDGDVPCKARCDRISTDRKLVIDLKTTATSAEPDSWARSQMVKLGYYTAASFYRRGVKAVYGVDCEYVFLVAEVEPPYLVSLVGVDNHAFELGSQKIDLALRRWSKCAADGSWPGFPTRVAYPEIPAWEQARWEEQQMLQLGQ